MNISLIPPFYKTRLQIVWPTLWKQMDIYSCGFHVLHYLDHFMFKGKDVTYKAPTPKNGNMEWKVFIFAQRQSHYKFPTPLAGNVFQ